MTGRLLLLLLAVILILAGAGAAKTCIEGVKEDRIMSSGRRTSRLQSRSTDPGGYWLTVAYNGVIAVGLSCAGAFVVWKAVGSPSARRQ